MSNYPDDMNWRAYDAAQGAGNTMGDASEIAWIKGGLELLNEAADKLREVDHSDALLTDTCADAGREIEVLIAAISRRMP